MGYIHSIGGHGDLQMWKRLRIALEMAGGVKVCRREMRKWEHKVGSIWGYLCAHLRVDDHTL